MRKAGVFHLLVCGEPLHAIRCATRTIGDVEAVLVQG